MQISSTSRAMYDRMAEATRLLFRSTRVDIEFSRTGWQQLMRNRPTSVPAFILAINLKADLALYITAHEEKGVFMDTECQEICYQPGVFLVIRQVGGTWYITDVIVSDENVIYTPVYFWTRIKRGCDVVAAKVLIRWRRLVRRPARNEASAITEAAVS